MSTCLLLLLLVSVGSYANEWQIRENLVFVPTSLSESRSWQSEMPVVDSVYTNLLTRNSEGAARLVPASLPMVRKPEGVADYETRIFQIEEEIGPFAPELTEVLHSLGTLYMDQGRYEEALASYEREAYIKRIHLGLYSEALVPVVKAEIRALDAAGMKQEADEKHQYLIHLMERSFGKNDARLLPELISYSEWNLSRFNEIVRYDLSDWALLSMNSGITTETDLRERAFENLDKASQHYVRAVSMLTRNKAFSDPALFKLESRLLEVAYLQANRQEVLRDADHYQHKLDLGELMYSRGPYARLTRDAYHYGIQSYERQLVYIANDPQGSKTRYIETLMALGDWYHLFGKNGASKEKYQEVLRLLQDNGIDSDVIASVMRPEVPVAIPTFAPTPHSAENLEQQGRTLNPFRGYIDVGFRINRNGDARNFEILGSSENTEKFIETRLRDTLRDAKFRPRIDESGEPADDTVSLRYFYTY